MIELSCDLGEASDETWRAVERGLWLLIDAANVACGGHAGDDDSMREAARLAAERGIILGAHPSYPDRENFGRRSMTMEPRELRKALIHQMSAFARIAEGQGVALQRIKAHGALYNDAHRERALAEVLVDAVAAIDESISIVAGDTSQMALVAREHGMHVIREAFADRRYMPDGSLVSRKDSDALLSVEEAAEQAERLAGKREVIAVWRRCVAARLRHAVHPRRHAAGARARPRHPRPPRLTRPAASPTMSVLRDGVV